MAFFLSTSRLTHAGTMAMRGAAIAKAKHIGQPQCIVNVDASGELLGEVCMTGAKFLSRKSALSKALTASATGGPSANIPPDVRTDLGLATGGNVTGLPGGLPIWINSDLVGGIGVGSGSGEQDDAVALTALQAIGATQ